MPCDAPRRASEQPQHVTWLLHRGQQPLHPLGAFGAAAEQKGCLEPSRLICCPPGLRNNFDEFRMETLMFKEDKSLQARLINHRGLLSLSSSLPSATLRCWELTLPKLFCIEGQKKNHQRAFFFTSLQGKDGAGKSCCLQQGCLAASRISIICLCNPKSGYPGKAAFISLLVASPTTAKQSSFPSATESCCHDGEGQGHELCASLQGPAEVLGL